MNYIDIIVLLSVLISVGLVIFFKVKEHKKGECASCPVPKKAKRALKDYKKSQHKGDN